MSTVKLLQEEIDSLQELKKRAQWLTSELGAIATQQLRLSIFQESLKQEMTDLITKEEKLSKEILEKYGPVSINLEEGTATVVS